MKGAAGVDPPLAPAPARAPREPAGTPGRWRVSGQVAVGGLVLGGAAAVCGWWVSQLLSAAPAGAGGRLAAGARLCGLGCGYLGAVQVLVAARLPWIERSVPLDRIRIFHAWTGVVFLGLAVAHAVLAVAAEAAASAAPFVGAALGLTLHSPYVWLAVLGLGVLVVVGFAAARPARRLLRYGWWHLVHLAVYPALAVSFFHQLYGVDLVATPARVLWTGLHLAALGAVCWFRVVTPLLVLRRHDMRVADVVVEAPGVASVWVSGRRLDRLGAQPGQYFRWRVLTRPMWRHSHPFSLSAVPTDDRLRFTVKAVGDYTEALLELRPGARVLAAGPWGAMTERARTRRRVLLVAGGMGIAPLRVLFETLDAEAGEITLVYRTSDPAEVIFAAEIDDLAGRVGAAVHVVHGRPAADAEADPLGPRPLAALVPDLVDHDVYVCGPPAMVAFTRRSVRAAGVDRRHVHGESFGF